MISIYFLLSLFSHSAEKETEENNTECLLLPEKGNLSVNTVSLLAHCLGNDIPRTKIEMETKSWICGSVPYPVMLLLEKCIYYQHAWARCICSHRLCFYFHILKVNHLLIFIKSFGFHQHSP